LRRADNDAAGLSKELRQHESTGRPLGDKTFVGKLEGLVGRCLAPAKRGPKTQDMPGKKAI
jgi:hypothetical protein